MEQEDKRIERMWMLREQWLSTFLSLWTSRQSREVEEHCAEKLETLAGSSLLSSSNSFNRNTESHWPMKRGLKATALKIKETVNTNSSCKERKAGDRDSVRSKGLNRVTSLIKIYKLAVSTLKSKHTSI